MRWFKGLAVVAVLTLVLPCTLMASSIPVSTVDFLAVYNQAGAPWTVLINKNVPPYGTPGWESTKVELDTIAIDNIERPGWLKHIWVEIDWLPGVSFVEPNLGGVAHYNLPVPHTLSLLNPEVIRDPNHNSITWHWVIPQCDEEKIVFPNSSYQQLVGIGRIDVATLCVPLPAAAWPGAMLLSGMLGLAAWRRFRA